MGMRHLVVISGPKLTLYLHNATVYKFDYEYSMNTRSIVFKQLHKSLVFLHQNTAHGRKFME